VLEWAKEGDEDVDVLRKKARTDVKSSAAPKGGRGSEKIDNVMKRSLDQVDLSDNDED
jgi:hypothetical protein